jgi:hypothetical protein
MVAVGHEPQSQRHAGEHQRPGVQVGDRAPAAEPDTRHPMMEVLAVRSVDGLLVLQPLEHDERRIQERDGQQDQRQHEGHDGRSLDGRLHGDAAHQQPQEVRAAVAHEARRGWKIVDQKAERGAGGQRGEHAGWSAAEVERGHRHRGGDDRAHARGQTVDAVGEVDDVHHRHQPDNRECRPGVRGPGIGECQMPHEGQRDRLHHDPEVHDDDRGRHLAHQLRRRR